MRNKRIITIATLSIALFAVGCTHEPMPGPSTNNVPGQPAAPADPENPSFINDILPIFIANCSGCHNTSTANDGYIFTSYETITAKKFVPGNPLATKLYDAITDDDEDDRMPQAPNPRLSAERITLIRNWIRNGAPNN
jgi:hypothetical protein